MIEDLKQAVETDDAAESEAGVATGASITWTKVFTWPAQA